MMTRVQRCVSKGAICGALLAAVSGLVQAENIEFEDGFNINKEVFEIGVNFGTLTIEDFPSEFVWTLSGTFHASEDYFIQYNYLSADIATSAFENNAAFSILDIGDDREFQHYDFLVGLNILQSEFIESPTEAALASLYLVAGVGDTKLGSEENFSYTLGLGYQVEFYEQFKLKADYRQHIFETSLISGQNSNTAIATQFTVGLSYIF